MKRKLLFTFLTALLLCVGIQAQTTITTYYVIPPTSGCNGVWAVSNSMSSACGGGSYTMSPWGCFQFTNNVSGDTAFWALCYFPCDVTMVTLNSVVCICGTGTTEGIENPAKEAVITTYPNPANSTDGWNIWFHEPDNLVGVRIFDSTGKLVMEEAPSESGQIYHVNTLGIPVGIYYAEISVNGSVTQEKLVLTK